MTVGCASTPASGPCSPTEPLPEPPARRADHLASSGGPTRSCPEMASNRRRPLIASRRRPTSSRAPGSGVFATWSTIMRPVSHRSPIVRRALVLPLLLILAVGATLPARADQENEQTMYHVANLGSLRGTASAGSSINNDGLSPATRTCRVMGRRTPRRGEPGRSARSTLAPSADPTAPCCGP